mgnify:CR=1 FL=1
MQDDIREQLIKQFPSDVVEILDQSGKPYYGCPTCKRAVTVGTDKCPGCGQKIRVPRGRGKIAIRCPKCNREFIRRS